MVSTGHGLAKKRCFLSESMIPEFSSLIVTGTWVSEETQSVCFLSWVCYVESHLNDAALQNQLRTVLGNEVYLLKKQWSERFCSKPLMYRFLMNLLKGWKTIYSTSSLLQDTVLSDVFSLLLSSIEHLMKSFVVYFKKNFRVMLSKDQDAASAWEEKQKNDNGTYRQTNTIATFETGWESFLELIYEIYVGRADAGLDWWTEADLAQFIRLAADVWTPRFLILFIRVLSALACGPNSANHAQNVLNMEHSGSLGHVTWTTFFRSLSSYAERLGQAESVVELSPPELGLIIAFLELLSEVVTHSYTARRVLCENQDFRALDTLFFLLVTRIPIELKAALLQSISAFCAPPFNSIDIANHIWNFIEQAQIVPINQDLYQENGLVRSSRLDTQLLNRGISYDMREIEANMQVYPETISFLHLINNLLASSQARGQQSVYEMLGVPNRPGGIRVYISFILDEVFLRLDEKQYHKESEQWEITQLCLDIILKSLEVFDMSPAINSLVEAKSLNSSMGPGVTNLNPLRTLGLQPGFEVLIRLLAGTQLTQRLFDIIVTGTEVKGSCTSVYTSLKIVKLVLKLHKTFLEVVAPALVQSQEAAILLLPSAMSGIDSLLASRNDVVLQLTCNINSESEDVCLISLHILFMLSQSSIFATTEQNYQLIPTNRLVSIIESSPKSNQIVQGFVDRLRAESVEGRLKDTVTIPNLSMFEPLEWDHSVGHHIKLMIMELIIWNLSSKNYPNIGHFLLGLHTRPDSQGSASQLQKSCLPAVAELLCQQSDSSIYTSQPIFAEKCLALVYLGISSNLTSTRVLRFLRNDHDFFMKQLEQFVPFHDASIELNQQDISRIHQCGWLLQSLAIELHMTAHAGQRSQTQRLLGSLFSVVNFNGIQNSDGAFNQDQQLEQSVTKIIEILGYLNFTDASLQPINLAQTVFEEINLADFMTWDSRGTEIFDVRSLHDLMVSFADSIDSSGGLIQYGGRGAVFEQIEAITLHLVEKNMNQQLINARFSCAKAWMDLVRVTVSQYFDLFPFEVRERRVFELLSNLLQQVNKPSVSLSIGTCASQTALALISRLKEDRIALSLVNGGHGRDMQSDSFHSLILKGILDGIQIPGSSSVMRGNYYSSLTAFLSYVAPADLNKNRKGVGKLNTNESFTEAVSLVFKQSNRFWDLLCRDATDAELVWQAVSFAALSSLCHIAGWYSSVGLANTHPMIQFLTKRNYLGHYIEMIKEADGVYGKVMEEDQSCNIILIIVTHEQENYRYVFETKMLFFLRLASSKAGADRLIEYGIFETFTDCRYLDQLPKTPDFSDIEDQAYDKYYAFTNPVFELISALLSHYDTTQTLIVKKLTQFLTSHQGTIIAILRKGTESLTIASLYQLKLLSGLFAWIGVSSELIHRIFPGPGQNSYFFSLVELLKHFSTPQWFNKLKPVTDIEMAKCERVGPFSVAGSKKSIFAEEATRLSENICRNILICCQKKQVDGFALKIEESVFTVLISESAEKLNHLILEEQNLQMKINDSTQVTAEEINDIAKYFHSKIYHELTLSQRQELYQRKLKDTLEYILEKIHTLYSILI
jgi:nuclear pore complex protein Nup205